MKKLIFLVAVMAVFVLPLRGQSSTGGFVSVVQDSQVDSVLLAYENIRLKVMENPDNKAIPGYRIQIFFDSGSNSSDRARTVQEAFALIYPEIPAYVSWKAPNYRVRVGDWRTRLEAEKALQLIMIDYPNAWVIKDEINFPVIN
jgi:hypothetical protein